MKKKRVFTAEQKMEVLREAEQNGMVVTCRKYDIAQSLYYQWKRKFDQHGIDGLQGQYYRVDPQMKELEKTIANIDADLVIIGTPIDLTRVIKIQKPSQRVRYELQEIGHPTLTDILQQKFGK